MLNKFNHLPLPLDGFLSEERRAESGYVDELLDRKVG